MDTARRHVGPALVCWTDATNTLPNTSSILARAGEAQVARHSRLSGVRANRFAAGRWLMARLIADLTGTDDAAISSVCSRCGADHGPPRATRAPVALSVSYSGSMVVAAAVARDHASAIGVDVELRRTNAPGRLENLRELFAPGHPPDLQGWTMLEAVLKADGRGMRVHPGHVRIGASSGTMLPASRLATVEGRTEHIEVGTVDGPSGYLVSVAVVPPAVGGAASESWRRETPVPREAGRNPATGRTGRLATSPSETPTGR